MQKQLFKLGTPRTLGSLLLVFSLVISSVSAQTVLTTVVRGTVVDTESKYPLEGVTVTVGNEKTITNALGQFKYSAIPIGRTTISAKIIGYEMTSRALELSSAKEAVLTLSLEESSTQLGTIEIRGNAGQGGAKNEMALVSARGFSVDETNLYAGSRGEPARMATNFAGVQGSDDQRNDLVIRGNTPAGVLYRMDGVNIPNPNHFSIPGTGGGPVTILNNKFLDNSDFYTGAWPAEYGNASAGVFDLKMRDGNNEKWETSFQLGLMGTELMIEGPLGKATTHHGAPSFLGVYRYSTLGLFQALKIPLGTTAIPQYMDGAFRFSFPKAKGAKLAWWGMFGQSDINILISNTDGDIVSSEFESYGTTDRDQYFSTDMYVTGLNYTKPLSAKTFLNIGAAVSRSFIDTDNDKVFREIQQNANGDSVWKVTSIVDILGYKFAENKLHTFAHYTKKLGNRSTLKYGVIADYYDLHYHDSLRFINGVTGTIDPWRVQWDTDTRWGVVQPYISYKGQLSERLSMTAGWTATASNVNTHSLSFIEPRLGLNFKQNKSTNWFAGTGIHSQMQSAYLYYYALTTINRDPQEHNTQMGLTKSFHTVGGVEHRLSSAPIRLKAEVYFQHLWDIPVESFKMNPLSGMRDLGSSFSMVNAGSGFGRLWPDTLENSGTGQNYGLELTAEHFFSRGFYGLATLSLFDAKYLGSDGVLRNTTFNGRYAANFILAKEWSLKGKKSFQLSGKFTTVGGRWFGPVDEVKSLENLEIRYISSTLNTVQYRPYFRTDVKLLRKWNYKKVSHQFGLDLANILNNKNLLTLTFVPDHPVNPVQEEYQLGLFPVFYYRVDF